jgi:hypothetical protein
MILSLLLLAPLSHGTVLLKDVRDKIVYYNVAGPDRAAIARTVRSVLIDVCLTIILVMGQ